jgi:hypothetical protein
VPKSEFDPEYLGGHTDWNSRWKPFQRKVINLVAGVLSQSPEEFAATFRPRIYWVCSHALGHDHTSGSGTGSGKTAISHYLQQVMGFSPDQVYKPTLRATTGAIDTSSFMEYNAERVILIDDILIHKDDSGVLRYKHDFLTMLRKVTDCVPFSARFGVDVNEVNIRAITVAFSNQAPPEDPAVRSRLKWIDIPEEDAVDHRKGQRKRSADAAIPQRLIIEAGMNQFIPAQRHGVCRSHYCVNQLSAQQASDAAQSSAGLSTNGGVGQQQCSVADELKLLRGNSGPRVPKPPTPPTPPPLVLFGTTWPTQPGAAPPSN